MKNMGSDLSAQLPKKTGLEEYDLVILGSGTGSTIAALWAYARATSVRLQCKQSCSRCDYDLAFPRVGFRFRVNSLDPGMVETDGLRTSGMDHGAFREQMEMQTPLGRIAQPEDFALATTFLARYDSRWITGQVIVAAGGRRM